MVGINEDIQYDTKPSSALIINIRTDGDN